MIARARCSTSIPPYWKSETDYGKGVFGPGDFARLAKILAGLKGAFILSINDAPEIRRAFAGFAIGQGRGGSKRGNYCDECDSDHGRHSMRLRWSV
jgi:hypothetical protein